MIAAAIAVLIGVYVAATGRGGELAYEHADHAPLDLGPVSATDIAMLHPPTALWGYNVDVTDEALGRIARAMRERDVTIAYLQSRLADLSPQTASLRPAAESAPRGSLAETARLRQAAGTPPLGPLAETARPRQATETARVRPAVETAPLGPAVETAPLGPAVETAPLGPAVETGPLGPASETTSAEPPGSRGQAARDDGALAPEERPW